MKDFLNIYHEFDESDAWKVRRKNIESFEIMIFKGSNDSFFKHI